MITAYRGTAFRTFTTPLRSRHDDLRARPVLAGHKLELIPEPLLFYRISKNSVSRSSDQNWNANRECSMQPYRNAIKPELRDLMAFMLENQRLYCGVMEKRATGSIRACSVAFYVAAAASRQRVPELPPRVAGEVS